MKFENDYGTLKITVCKVVSLNLGMNLGYAKIVPKLLTEQSRKILPLNCSLIVPKKIIIGGESWVYGYETKLKSSQWTEPQPKNGR